MNEYKQRGLYILITNHLHKIDLTVAGLNGVQVPKRERNTMKQRQKQKILNVCIFMKFYEFHYTDLHLCYLQLLFGKNI